MTKRAHWSGELLVLAFLLVAYDAVAGLADLRAERAFDNGRALLTPFDVERSANLWLAGVGWLHDPAAYYYDLAHINVTVIALLLCYVLRPGLYRQARTALVLTNVVALAVFWAYPVAPPRLLPDGGFVDVVARSRTWGAWESGVAERANELSAMPSLHLAWAVWVALAVWSLTRDRRLRALGWVHVLLTSLVVVLTGNHYLVDLVAGAALAVAAWHAAAWFSQRLHR